MLRYKLNLHTEPSCYPNRNIQSRELRNNIKYTPINNRLPNVAKHLQYGGYQTAIIGKWHLGEGKNHEPTGFDYWSVLPGQGDYFDPVFIEMEKEVEEQGYATDIITSKCIDWLSSRNKNQPFFLMCHHKAPHREWEPHPKNRKLYEKDIKVPETYDDDYKNRACLLYTSPSPRDIS